MRERERVLDLIPGHLLTFSAPLSHDIRKNEIRRVVEFFVPSKHRFKPFFVGIPNVKELTSERSEKVPGLHGWSGELKRERGGLDIG